MCWTAGTVVYHILFLLQSCLYRGVWRVWRVAERGVTRHNQQLDCNPDQWFLTLHFSQVHILWECKVFVCLKNYSVLLCSCDLIIQQLQSNSVVWIKDRATEWFGPQGEGGEVIGVENSPTSSTPVLKPLQNKSLQTVEWNQFSMHSHLHLFIWMQILMEYRWALDPHNIYKYKIHQSFKLFSTAAQAVSANSWHDALAEGRKRTTS